MILAEFDCYRAAFRQLTLQAQARFEAADWLGLQKDSARRLDLYTDGVGTAVSHLNELFGDVPRDKAAWRALKPAYARLVDGRDDLDLAETFFNSVTRRVFSTVGVDPEIEFVSTDEPAARGADPDALVHTFPCSGGFVDAIRTALLSCRFTIPYENVDRDADLIARAIAVQHPPEIVDAIELVRPVFYRSKQAFLVGRLRGRGPSTPLVIALVWRDGAVVADAALVTEDEVSIVFSFTRSYFFVDADRPAELVAFLRSIMPLKPIGELYNSIGHNKHGKTELYRSLLRHLQDSSDQFEIAPGARGMVMTVFTLPSHDTVFKVIRDVFDYPKTVTREDVRSKYRLVFRHDRAGRLVDAQEFEHFQFDRSRFSGELLTELANVAHETVEIGEDAVVIHHLYTERRLVPLDLYLRSAAPEDARRAVLDYGTVLRDLAATNIFPGDLLLKNFGVSRHGRVIFYDYDELTLLTDCNFRSLPAPRDDEERTAGEPWFYVGERDIFPEEFLPFLGLRRELRDVFLEAHGELLTPEFWIRMQDEHRAGHVLDIFPYPAARRLRP